MIYIGCEDKRTIYRIGPSGIERVRNGTDEVLIINGCAPELDDFSATGELSRWLKGDTWANPVGRMILALYAPYLALGASAYSERPLLAGIGEKRSGKTTTLQLMGKAIHGELPIAQAYGSKARGMTKRLLNEKFAIVDNMESPPRNPEEPPDDFFASACTSSVRAVDKLYTSCDQTKKPITAFFAVTSICVPDCLKRSDVADRLLVVNFHRPEGKLTTSIAGRSPDRKGVWRDVLQMLFRIDKVWKDVPTSHEFRVGSFMRFAHSLLQKEAALALEQAILAEQGRTMATDDPIAQALSTHPPAPAMTAKSLLDFWVKAGALEPPQSGAIGLGKMLSRRQGKCGRWEIRGERDTDTNLTFWSFAQASREGGLNADEADRLLDTMVLPPANLRA